MSTEKNYDISKFGKETLFNYIYKFGKETLFLIKGYSLQGGHSDSLRNSLQQITPNRYYARMNGTETYAEEVGQLYIFNNLSEGP